MKKRFACLFLALMLAFGAAASAESVKVGLIGPTEINFQTANKG